MNSEEVVIIVSNPPPFKEISPYGEMERQIIGRNNSWLLLGAFDSMFSFSVRKSYDKRVAGGYR